MRVSDVMTKEVRTISALARADDAWELMRTQGIHHLVVTEGSRVVGVLSNRDAGGKRGAAVRAEARVADLMTGSVVTATPDTTIRRAALLMRGRTIGCLPIVKGTRLVGIVTVSDLLDVLGRGVERPVTPQRHGLRYRVPHRKQTGGAAGVW
jgi:CBS domain-containing protein